MHEIESDLEEQKIAAIIVGQNTANRASATSHLGQQLILLENAIMSLEQARDMVRKQILHG